MDDVQAGERRELTPTLVHLYCPMDLLRSKALSLWREDLRINQSPPVPGCSVTSRKADDRGEGEAEKFHQSEMWSLSLSLVDKQQNKVASTFQPSYGSCTIAKGLSLKTMMSDVSVSLLAPKKEVAEN